jgi:anaerobic dimethyl sulfoxide reductase subunit C (anchor subunit)
MTGDALREWPLVFFTTLTQLAVGAFVLWGLAAGLHPSPNPFSMTMFSRLLLSSVLVSLVLGVLAAATHLGRPVGAFFSLSNWRSSWLSREALLAAFFGLVVLVALCLRLVGYPIGWTDHLVILIGCVSGLSLVYGISRLYRLRTVPAWNNKGTTAAFFTTSLLTGVVTIMITWLLLTERDAAFASQSLKSQVAGLSNTLIFLSVVIQAIIFSFQVIYLNHLGGAGAESVRILWKKLRGVLFYRWLAAVVGVAILIFNERLVLVLLAYFLLLASEIMGRFLFYAFYQRAGY